MNFKIFSLFQFQNATEVINKICHNYPNIETLMYESFPLEFFLYGETVYHGSSLYDTPNEEKFLKLRNICVIFNTKRDYINLNMETTRTRFIDYLKQKCPNITNFYSKEERSKPNRNSYQEFITLEFHGKSD